MGQRFASFNGVQIPRHSERAWYTPVFGDLPLAHIVTEWPSVTLYNFSYCEDLVNIRPPYPKSSLSLVHFGFTD